MENTEDSIAKLSKIIDDINFVDVQIENFVLLSELLVSSKNNMDIILEALPLDGVQPSVLPIFRPPDIDAFKSAYMNDEEPPSTPPSHIGYQRFYDYHKLTENVTTVFATMDNNMALATLQFIVSRLKTKRTQLIQLYKITKAE